MKNFVLTLFFSSYIAKYNLSSVYSDITDILALEQRSDKWLF